MTPEMRQESMRCAIYTRKSIDKGLELEFNSLEAQRAICSSYIASQRPKGWTELPKHYDDGGISGAHLSRPALQDLLSDVESGLVDIVVIYKLDRITRSLLDFVRLMDLFDHYGVAFVAVTQNFDTADSTGRLIMNILLTFAQFEREITSDRIKDRLTALRQRGIFVGARPPYGYDMVKGKLEVNPRQAKVVRWIFNQYVAGKKETLIARELSNMGVLRRTRVSTRGRVIEKRGICRSSIWRMLDNIHYVGEVQAKGVRYPAQHEAIISRSVWNKVEAQREKQRKANAIRFDKTEILRDILYDSHGRKMWVHHDYRYQKVGRYYVSGQTEWGRRHGVRRVRTKADELEKLVVAAITSMLADRERVRAMLLRLGVFDHRLNKLPAAGEAMAKQFDRLSLKQTQCLLRALIIRIELTNTLVKIIIRTPELPRVLVWDGVGLFRGDTDAWSRPHVTDVIDVPANAVSLKRELTHLLVRKTGDAVTKPNKRLVALLKKARAAQVVMDNREIYSVNELAARLHCHPKLFTSLVRLNYLAPDIIASILDGTQPPHINCAALRNVDLPLDWTLQRRLLGFPAQPDFLRVAPGW